MSVKTDILTTPERYAYADRLGSIAESCLLFAECYRMFLNAMVQQAGYA